MMELLQRFDQQEIHREPDRSAPVRIAAEQTGRRFAWLIVDAVFSSVRSQNIGMLPMNPRYRTDAVGRKKLIFIQHHFQNSPQLLAVHDRQQPPFSLARSLHAGDVVRKVWAIFDEPFEPPLEALQ